MFNNREIKMQIVKTPKQAPTTEQEARPRMTPIEIISLSRIVTLDAAALIGAGYAAKKILDTASEIALIAAKAKFK